MKARKQWLVICADGVRGIETATPGKIRRLLSGRVILSARECAPLRTRTLVDGSTILA